MKTISTQGYSPILSDKLKAQKLYNEIMAESPSTEVIEINLEPMISMTTYCAKMIFGRLYNELGPEVFYNNIRIAKASEDILLIIKMGIKSAI